MQELFIALIEDDEDDVGLMTDCFKKQSSFSIKSFSSGQDFLDYSLNGSLPCLFVVDLNLPDIRGLYFVEQIRLNSVLTNVPVIIYTTDYTRHEAKACEELNIQLLKKPDSLQEWDNIAAAMLQYCNTGL